MDPEKVDAMIKWPKPTTVKALLGFLGLMGYYHKFIQNYGKISALLTNMLKKNGFQWDTRSEASFEQLKIAMKKAPVLALPELSKSFVIECDALGTGIGGVLMQEKCPIAFFSQALRVCDRDPVFTSTFWEELLHLQGTSFNFFSSCHLQTNDQTEVVNRTVEMYLRCFTGDKPKEWVRWITWAEYCYNRSVHSSTKKTPFEIVYVRPPPTLLSYVPGTTQVEAVDKELCAHDQVLKELKDQLLIAQNRMKRFYDVGQTGKSFKVGDLCTYVSNHISKFQFHLEETLNYLQGLVSGYLLDFKLETAERAGPRICLGKEMAFLQMKRVVSVVLKRFKAVPVMEEGVEPKFVAQLTAKMKGGFPVKIEDRTK
ncbi:uncharacterized protein LOC116140125 [Pistacia vera]|uniref:uncharacterized protein LOC116140125 n=1 Tax=Pistacia vera TaxID=55513 RepID=UPI0012637DBE|nr:uncharacterized protein LOC116140125 [Pistacia vera]